MRFTYVRADKAIGIDGNFLYFDSIDFDSQVDAIQWYDTWGEIEFVNRQERNNERFEDISYIQPLIKLWEYEDTRIKAEEAAAAIANSAVAAALSESEVTE